MPRKDYSRKKFTHPLKRKRRTRVPLSNTVKKYSLRIGVLSALVGGIYAVLFSSWMNIQNVTVEGARQTDVHTTTWHWLETQATKKHLQRFAGNHFFFIPTHELEDLLTTEKYVNTITVEKKFPRTLVVNVNERTGSFAYYLGVHKHIIDTDGILLDTVLPGTGEDPENADLYVGLPMVLGTSTEPFVVNDESNFTPELTEFIITIDTEFPKFFTSATIERLVFTEQGSNLATYVSEGWYALFNPTADPITQLANLSRIYKETLSETERNNLEYIDVRLENYVYYK